MDRVELLKNRREKLLESGSEIRKKIASIIDEGSFVELSSYSFSKNEFYGETAEGEGVVTGFATVEGNPCYIVAQNAKVLSGGVSKANCDKICKTLIAAQNNSTPVIYFLDSKGVQIGEGVNVLEGIADVLYEMNELRGNVPQFAVIDGDCFGSFALIAAACDFTFYTENACVSYAAPSVIAAASNKPATKAEVGGTASVAATGIAEFIVKNIEEIKGTIVDLLDLLPDTGVAVTDAEDDLNRTSPELNSSVDADSLIKAVFDDGKAVELGSGFAPEVACLLGRIGGISVASLMFRGGESGVELTSSIAEKINNFLVIAADYGLPLVNFVNAKGISRSYEVGRSTVLTKISNIVYNIKDLTKISVVYGKAVGLGYSLFAAKAMGYDYSYAFCNAQISLFDGVEGARVEFDGVRFDNEEEFVRKYAEENQDPINAAKGGYIDNIIEPQFVRQYLISSLQMSVR